MDDVVDVASETYAKGAARELTDCREARANDLVRVVLKVEGALSLDLCELFLADEPGQADCRLSI